MFRDEHSVQFVSSSLDWLFCFYGKPCRHTVFTQICSAIYSSIQMLPAATPRCHATQYLDNESSLSSVVRLVLAGCILPACSAVSLSRRRRCRLSALLAGRPLTSFTSTSGSSILSSASSLLVRCRKYTATTHASTNSGKKMDAITSAVTMA